LAETRRWGAALALVALLGAGPETARASTGQDSLRSFLPENGAAASWSKDGDPQEFAGEDLYTYIDGGAEIYQEYGFRRVVIQDYRNPAGRSVSLEIFQMETPAAAYGMFTFKRSGKGKIVPLGTGGELEDYYLNFWKGTFLVTLTGFDETAGTIEGILAVGGAVDAKIPDRAGPPDLVSALPERGLKPGSLKYLKGLLALNNVYPFYTARGLDFREAVGGGYGDGATLLVLDYGTTGALREAVDELGHYLAASERFKKLAGNAPEIDTLRVVDGKGRYLGLMARKTRLYIGIGPNSEVVSSLLQQPAR
jgi:hypothetical protein